MLHDKKFDCIFATAKGESRDFTVNAKIAQLVEHNLAKVGVAGSSPVFRSKDIEKVSLSRKRQTRK